MTSFTCGLLPGKKQTIKLMLLIQRLLSLLLFFLRKKRVSSATKERISAEGVIYHHAPNLKIRITLEKE